MENSVTSTPFEYLPFGSWRVPCNPPGRLWHALRVHRHLSVRQGLSAFGCFRRHFGCFRHRSARAGHDALWPWPSSWQSWCPWPLVDTCGASWRASPPWLRQTMISITVFFFNYELYVSNCPLNHFVICGKFPITRTVPFLPNSMRMEIWKIAKINFDSL